MSRDVGWDQVVDLQCSTLQRLMEKAIQLTQRSGVLKAEMARLVEATQAARDENARQRNEVEVDLYRALSDFCEKHDSYLTTVRDLLKAVGKSERLSTWEAELVKAESWSARVDYIGDHRLESFLYYARYMVKFYDGLIPATISKYHALLPQLELQMCELKLCQFKLLKLQGEGNDRQKKVLASRLKKLKKNAKERSDVKLKEKVKALLTELDALDNETQKSVEYVRFLRLYTVLSAALAASVNELSVSMAQTQNATYITKLVAYATQTTALHTEFADCEVDMGMNDNEFAAFLQENLSLFLAAYREYYQKEFVDSIWEDYYQSPDNVADFEAQYAEPSDAQVASFKRFGRQDLTDVDARTAIRQERYRDFVKGKVKVWLESDDDCVEIEYERFLLDKLQKQFVKPLQPLDVKIGGAQAEPSAFSTPPRRRAAPKMPTTPVRSKQLVAALKQRLRETGRDADVEVAAASTASESTRTPPRPRSVARTSMAPSPGVNRQLRDAFRMELDQVMQQRGLKARVGEGAGLFDNHEPLDFVDEAADVSALRYTVTAEGGASCS